MTWDALGIPFPEWVPSPLETIGFLTGAACVWLVVRRHILNFPLGIVNCVCFLVLFLQQRLFGEASLQLFFIALGFHGWYWWLRGDPQQAAKITVRTTPRTELAILGGVLVIATLTLWQFLIEVNGSAPLLDALVTALSLVAQWMLNRKYLDSWLVWMAVDVLTVYLSITRGLYLVAALYVIFFAMCVVGWIEWRKALRGSLSFSPLPLGERGRGEGPG